MTVSIIFLILAVLLAGIFFLVYFNRNNQVTDAQRFKTEFKRETLHEVGIEHIRPKEKTTETPRPSLQTEQASAEPSPRTLKPVSSNTDEILSVRAKTTPTKTSSSPLPQVAPPTFLKIKAAPISQVHPTPHNESDPTPVDIQQVFKHTLEAVKAASMAHTVVLLRLGQHHAFIEGIFSEEKAIRPHIQIPRSTPFLRVIDPKEQISVLTASEIAETPLYYAKHIELIGLIAAPIHLQDGLWGYLVADATATHSVHHPGILSGFAQTLSAVIAEHKKTTSINSGPTVWAGHATRPRKEIIADEMRKARNQNLPLVFALIYLNQYIAADKELTSDVIVARESELWQGVEKAIRNIGRIERFGELMVGVFLYGTTFNAEDWISDIQYNLTSEMRFPAQSISIGGVLMNDTHTDGSALLADAIEALKQVQQGGAALIG
ncbi:MAG: hypothetical protein JNN12_08085 [Bacteroidetes Order II. Incertae sedis bacterium]|nr:hypothetical protein [Bacteroidetes Order II. bacterium]